MTHEEFLIDIDKYLPYNLVQIIDTPNHISYSCVRQALVDFSNRRKPRLVVEVEDNDWVRNPLTNEFEYNQRIWTMPEVNHASLVPVVDAATGQPKTEMKWVTEVLFNEESGELEPQRIYKEVPREISEIRMWQLLVSDTGTVTMSKAFKDAIVRQRAIQRKEPNIPPLLFPES